MTIDEAIKNLTAGRQDAGMIPEGRYTETIDFAILTLKVMKTHPWARNAKTALYKQWSEGRNVLQ